MAHRVNLRARGAYHFTYSGRCVLVTDLAGRVGEQDPLGLYVDNVRLLSRLELSVNGKSPRPISASPVGDAFLAYEELPQADGLPKGSVYLETARFVGDGMRTVLRLRNYAGEMARFKLAIHLAADFADSQEAEQRRRQQSAEVETAWDEAAGELRFHYCHSQLDRGVAIRVERSPEPAHWREGALRLQLELTPRGSAELELTVEPMVDGKRIACTPRRLFGKPEAPLERLRAELANEMPRLTSSNATVMKAWETATRDLASLPYGLADGPFRARLSSTPSPGRGTPSGACAATASTGCRWHGRCAARPTCWERRPGSCASWSPTLATVVR